MNLGAWDWEKKPSLGATSAHGPGTHTLYDFIIPSRITLHKIQNFAFFIYLFSFFLIFCWSNAAKVMQMFLCVESFFWYQKYQKYSQKQKILEKIVRIIWTSWATWQIFELGISFPQENPHKKIKESDFGLRWI